jgi:2,4-dienoyl-CoA reductase (NADPH2)
MGIDEIKEVQEAFVRASERAKEAGFDGVEIIGSAGYLITQFLSPLRNKRTDEYGGSFENRIRFPREIIEMLRKRLGQDYPITIRMAGNDFVPGSNTDLETPLFAQVYEKAGIDAINVTGGWHESRVPQLSMELPRSGFTYLAQNIINAVSVPVMASNRINDPFSAEQILVDGMADIINLGRVLIADPYWPQKAMDGRVDEIRPCISCNQGCMDEIFNGRPAFCLANCEAGFEESRRITRSSSPKKVMVIGAGPGGLEAAVRAAEAGHRVSLYEKSGCIGGQLWIAGTPPYKNELWELARYYDAMLDKYNVNVHLEQEADIELIKKENPDYIIAAEGAEPAEPSVEGIDDPYVYNAWDVLANDPKLGKRIAVIGGGSVGLETAHFLAIKGTISPETLYFLFKYNAEPAERLRELITKGNKEITVFEMTMKAGTGVGRSTRWILMENISIHNIKIIYNAKVISIKNGHIKYEQTGEEHSMQFDNVVTAIGSKPLRKVADKLELLGIPYKIIGDSRKIGQINNAIHEGYLAVMEI